MYHSIFNHSSVNTCFHVLAIIDSAAVNIGVHVSFSILASSGYMLNSGITGSCGGFVPRFLRNLHTIFHSVCVSLYSHQQRKRIPFSSHPLQHLLFVDILMVTILIGVRWCFIAALICLSFLTSDDKHLFMCLLAVRMFSLEKWLFRSFSYILIGLFVFLVLTCMNHLIYFGNLSFVNCFICYYSPILMVVFSPCL